MFKTMQNAWKIPDLRKKILFTLLVIIVFRIGANMPAPFLNMEALAGLMGFVYKLPLLLRPRQTTHHSERLLVHLLAFFHPDVIHLSVDIIHCCDCRKPDLVLHLPCRQIDSRVVNEKFLFYDTRTPFQNKEVCRWLLSCQNTPILSDNLVR